MKKTIHFSKFFIPAAIISAVLVIFSVFGLVYNKGFALGVDFEAGLIQEVQIAPPAFGLRWNGMSNAEIQHDSNGIYIIIFGSGIESSTVPFLYAAHPTVGAIKRAMEEQIEDIQMELDSAANESVISPWLKFNPHMDPLLNNETPYIVHYLNPEKAPIDISEIRSAMEVDDFKHNVSVQNLGTPADRQFMIRVEAKEEGRVTSNEIVNVLEAAFGKDSIIVLRFDEVDSRFSKDLTDQAGVLISLTLLLILIYSAIRFRLQFAVGAVIAIIYDVLVIIAFVVWTRMEFTTLTIAAILTILGYSTNNTIILFDRIRENLRIYPDNSFLDVLNMSLTGIFGRTIITTASTMLAVMALFIFTTGSMKDFALALLVGMLSGVYTTLFIVSGFVYLWDRLRANKKKKKAVTA